MARICVSLTDETTAAVIDRMARLAPVADLFEVRGDYVTDLDLPAIRAARTKPLLFTCRSASEGGKRDDKDPARRAALMEAVQLGFDWVDMEYKSGFIDLMVAKAGRGLIVSHHDFTGTPADLAKLYGRMAATGADVVKIAVTPQSIADVGRLMDLAARVAEGHGPVLIPIAMGPMGTISRLTAGRHKAPFTYAAPEVGREAAPGQITAPTMAGLYRVRSFNPATRVYGLLGTDVMRSLSPEIHNRAFAACGLDAVYVPLQAESLPAFLEALPSLGLSGFSVTRPYKWDILPFLDEVDEAARAAGSVNTVSVSGSRLVGTSTDGIGVTQPLEAIAPLEGQTVAILGAGGAARAAAFALLAKGANVTLYARNLEKARAVAGELGIGVASLEMVADRPWDILMNATPVGSGAMPGESLVPAAAHRAGSVVFDMVYEPLETPLLRDAREAGAMGIDGLQMLVAQAVGQFEIWTRGDAPVDVMEAAAYGAAARAAK